MITDLPCPPAISQPEPDEELTLGSDEITWSHIEGVSDPDLDICSGDDVELVSFHVVVEYEYENAGEDILLVFAVDMEPGAIALDVPDDFLEEGMDAGADFKVEILAIVESGSRTITEVEFEVGEP